MLAAIIIAAGLIVLYVAFDRRRYTGFRPGSGIRPTAEVFRDPASGRLMRVWLDPVTGSREYREEAEK